MKRVTFEPSQTFQEKQLFLPFVDDDINELNEGFVIEIKVDEEESNPEDVANLKYRFNGVALIRITNDDGEPSRRVHCSLETISVRLSA